MLAICHTLLFSKKPRRSLFETHTRRSEQTETTSEEDDHHAVLTNPTTIYQTAIIQHQPNMKIQFFYAHPQQARTIAAGSEEDPATQPSIEFTAPKQRPQHARPTPTKRVVRFANESENQSYDSNFTHQGECKALWYNRSDMMLFKLQNRQQIRDLRQLEQIMLGETDTETWSKVYTAAYQVCINASTAQDVVHGLSAQRCTTMDIFTAGMEKKGIQRIALDSLQRRRQLWANVMYLQKSYYYGAINNDVHIRQVCRDLSRPSRLYARHIALVAAATEL